MYVEALVSTVVSCDACLPLVFLFFSQELSLNLELTDWLGWTANKLHESICLSLCSTGITGACHHMGPGRLNSSLHAYTTVHRAISSVPQGGFPWVKIQGEALAYCLPGIISQESHFACWNFTSFMKEIRSIKTAPKSSCVVSINSQRRCVCKAINTP